MMENDDQLLAQFFAEQVHEIEDNGFTERVLRQLPARSARLNRIWTAICVAIGLLMLYFNIANYDIERLKKDGLHLVNDLIIQLYGFMNHAGETFLSHIQTVDLSRQSLMTVAIGVATLTALAVYNVVQEER
ncbi:MAG: DUF5056 domain-containing protein [Prevotella sp.]|nr:DUF5056 domain-containing protein [Prevotella sp.]